MLKKTLTLSLFLTTALCSLSGMEMQEQSSDQIHETVEFPPGKEVMKEIRAAYDKGNFALYLKTLDEEYHKAVKEKMFDKVLENRRKARKEQLAAAKNWHDVLDSLDKARNKQLLELSETDDSLEVSKKVHDIADFSIAAEDEAALNYIYSLQAKSIGEGKNPSEEKLIEIDREYQLKSLLMTFAQLKTNKDPQTQRAQKIVLNLEKMEKMRAAAKDFEDREIAKLVDEAAGTFPAYRAHKIDIEDLESLAYGKLVPTNSVEKKVKSAMTAYLEKRDNATEGAGEVIE